MINHVVAMLSNCFQTRLSENEKNWYGMDVMVKVDEVKETENKESKRR